MLREACDVFQDASEDLHLEIHTHHRPIKGKAASGYPLGKGSAVCRHEGHRLQRRCCLNSQH